MHVAELGLSPAALAALKAAHIHDVDRLLEHASSDLIQRPAFAKGTELYEIVCVLHRHGLTLSRHRRWHSERELEMFRLRVVEGLTLAQIARRFSLHVERIRQILREHFRLTGVPPAAKVRRAAATAKRRADDLARAQSQSSQLLTAWRAGADIKQLAQTFEVSWNSTEQTIHLVAISSDHAVRAQAHRRISEKQSR